MPPTRRPTATLLLAVALAAVVASAPALAGAVVRYAQNADKVDGRHAVGSGASRAERAGKLVATGPDGRLPGDVIRTAPNSARLQGMSPDELGRASADRTTHEIDGIDSTAPTALHATTVTAPVRGILLVWGQFGATRDGESRRRTRARLEAGLALDGRRVGAPQVVELAPEHRSDSLSLAAAAPVAPGDHTVTIVARRAGGRALVRIHPRPSQALFVPFGNGGVQGSP